MPIHNFPTQKRETEIPSQPRAGVWERSGATLLQMARSLRVDEDNPYSDPNEPIRAIPDPWSQARTFGEALLDVDHTIHKDVVPAWRGLLALLALQPTLAPAYTVEPKSAALAPRGGDLFSDVLRALRPAIAIGGQAALWETPWLLQCRGVTVAMTNPICLLSPGRLSGEVKVDGVPWMQGVIVDPLSLAEERRLSVPQLVALFQWLSALHGTLIAMNDGVANRLASRVEDYRNDVGAAGGAADLRTNRQAGVEELPPLFNLLFERVSVAPIDNPAAQSQARVRLQNGLDLGAIKGIILVDQAMAALPGVNPQATFVWGMHTLADLLGNPALLAKVKGEAAAQGYCVATVDDFLTDRLIKLYAARADVGPAIDGHPGSMADMLVPVRPLALLTADEQGGGRIADRVQCEEGSESAVISLAVYLDGHLDPVRLIRRYVVNAAAGAPQFVKSVQWTLPSAAIWPNFRSVAWNRYYARFYYDKMQAKQRAIPVSAMSAAIVAAQLRTDRDPVAALALLAKLNDGQVPNRIDGAFDQSVLESHGADGELYDEMQFSSVPFDAITYQEEADGRRRTLVGMALLMVTEKKVEARSSVVALDFGTTNTVACVDSSSAAPVIFKQRVIFPIQPRQSDTRLQVMASLRRVLVPFMPPQDRRSPNATVAYNRIPGLRKTSVGMFSNLIYFHSQFAIAQHAELAELTEFHRLLTNTRFNLKWSAQAEVKEAAVDYLEQYMTMVAAEVLAEHGADPRHIRWRFSVPDSMPVRDQRTLRSNLTRKASGISTEVRSADGSSDAVDELYSEGLCAATYLLEGMRFQTDSINMVLDIGGGTTDVAIFEGTQLRWRGSFRIAGKDFFTTLLSYNPKLLDLLNLNSWAKMFNPDTPLPANMRRDQLPHLAELLFSVTASDGAGLDLKSAIDNFWDDRIEAKDGDLLRLSGLVFIAGIAWYLGFVVRELLERNAFANPDLAKTPAFALCGRGAGVFKKMHGNRRADADSDVTDATSVFGVSSGIVDARQPQFMASQAEKLEVVRGMLVERSSIERYVVQRAQSNALTFAPAGIGVTFADGTVLAADASIDSMPLTHDVRSVDLGEFDRFIQSLRANGNIRIDLNRDRPQGAYKAIETAVKRRMSDELRDNPAKDGPTAIPEPPFISALRALVVAIAAAPDDRDGSITVEFA